MTIRTFEIRCPIYGFVSLDEWERDVIAQPAFQRLRRIRQLGWTDAVYPGAMHTRFEHSLGVMHMASQLYDGVERRCRDILRSEYHYDEAVTRRYRRLVRLAALLHDLGHGPFSHAVEELAPRLDASRGARRYRHEDYSVAIIRKYFAEVIESHPSNSDDNIRLDEITGLIEGNNPSEQAAVWQDVISGQLDADRMDYLLRDSHHAGVDYGKYDWRRMVNSAELVQDPESGEWRLGVADGGRHVAEALIIARYMMFSQVYFHKVRVILDYHLHQAVETLLPDGRFPPPTDAGLAAFLEWDDWRVLGAFSRGEGGDHAARLRDRQFYRLVYQTPEFPDSEDEMRLSAAEAKLDNIAFVRREARKSWYKIGAEDLPVSASTVGGPVKLLSAKSSIIRHMAPSRSVRLYVSPSARQEALRRLQSAGSE